MNLIICLDNNNGMGFAGRRQSADRVLARHILSFTANTKVWMSPHSAAFFGESPDNFVFRQTYWMDAGEQDYCFAEYDFPPEAIKLVRSIIVYRWNRFYPADRYFPAEELMKRSKRVGSEFSGSSHERITQEIYSL